LAASFGLAKKSRFTAAKACVADVINRCRRVLYFSSIGHEPGCNVEVAAFFLTEQKSPTAMWGKERMSFPGSDKGKDSGKAI